MGAPGAARRRVRLGHWRQAKDIAISLVWAGYQATRKGRLLDTNAPLEKIWEAAKVNGVARSCIYAGAPRKKVA